MAFAMYITKNSLITAIILPFILTHASEAATSTSSSGDSDTVVVEVSGNVPGFTQPQLAAYLAGRMHEEIADPWQFSAGKPGAAPAANRVVSSFNTLRMVWKGGSHRGFTSSENSVAYLGAEVKLYLKHTYQLTTIAHPSVSSASDDQNLSEMVHDVAPILFVASKPDMPSNEHGKITSHGNA